MDESSQQTQKKRTPPALFRFQLPMMFIQLISLSTMLCFCEGEQLIKLDYNPGINILDLGQAHTYKKSFYSYFIYNISNLHEQYKKIIVFEEEISTKINNNNDMEFRNATENGMIILKSNIKQLERKINNLFNQHRRSKRGIFNILGTGIKAITGNLDANDGEKYDDLFRQIHENQIILQQQNDENIRINKEIESKFNERIEIIQQNELKLKTQMDFIFKQAKERFYSLQIDKIIAQLTFLSLDLNQILDGIETSLTFCNLNQIHSSIITNDELYRVLEGTNRTKTSYFWEISALITSHCRISENQIEYLLDIPEYSTNKGEKLLQITPIPTIDNKKMFFIDEEKKFIILNQEKSRVYNAHDCRRVKEHYYCRTNHVEIDSCIENIILDHNNTQCKYDKIDDAFLVMEMENENVAIIASSSKKKVTVDCSNKTSIHYIEGVYKFSTDSGCTIDDYILGKKRTLGKEITFKNLHFNITATQISDTSLDLKQTDKTGIFFKAVPRIKNIIVGTYYHGYINSALIIVLIIVVKGIVVCLVLKYKYKLKCKSKYQKKYYKVHDEAQV